MKERFCKLATLSSISLTVYTGSPITNCKFWFAIYEVKNYDILHFQTIFWNFSQAQFWWNNLQFNVLTPCILIFWTKIFLIAIVNCWIWKNLNAVIFVKLQNHLRNSCVFLKWMFWLITDCFIVIFDGEMRSKNQNTKHCNFVTRLESLQKLP